jgi:oligopeptidase B
VAETAVSPDHNLLAYSVDADGAEHNTLKVRDLTTGQDLADTIPEVRGGAVWSTDSRWLFYVGRDPSKWGQKVFRHRLGTATTKDELVYEEKAEGFSASVRITLSDRFLVIEASDFSTADVRLVDLADPTGRRGPSPSAGGTEVCGHGPRRSPDLSHHADGAIDGNRGSPSAAAFSAARDRPHLAGGDRGAHRLPPASRLARAQPRVAASRSAFGAGRTVRARDHLRRRAGQDRHPDGARADTRTLRYSYQSCAAQAGVDTTWRRGRTLERTTCRAVTTPRATSRAVSLLLTEDSPACPSPSSPQNTKLDGSAPVWLQLPAYGDKGGAEFGIERLSLVDRGFIYAIAHVRGGGEKGDAWHEAGRLASKVNSFTDFLAVAEHLVREGLTRPGRIVASGASAGGMLVGAAVNMRPDLFGGVYAEVPFVDCLNTLLDRDLPLTEASFSEFGNPIDSRADFVNIQSYAPYENVRAQAYPPMLISQSLNDSRVPYWEAAKWVAKLRHLKTDGNPVMLYIKMRGGHSGGSGRFDNLEDYARAYAFALGIAADKGSDPSAQRVILRDAN